MAGTAFTSRSDYVLDFRGLHQVGKQRRRVRVKATDPRATDLNTASAWAQECDRYCRLLEVAPDPHDVQHAVRIRAITSEQGAALLNGLPVPAATEHAKRLSIEEAALRHPSTQRDPLARKVEYLKYLKQFTDFAKVDAVGDVKLDQVQRWIAKMRADKLAPATRRHRLLYVRRATRMASTEGMPDVIGGLRLDVTGAPTVEAWTLAELQQACRAFLKANNLRALVATALGGFLGLRPSEVFRARCGDFARHELAIGQDGRPAKNAASRRRLPLPATLDRWASDLAKDRPADEPLLVTAGNGGGRAFRTETFSQWLMPLLRDATGRRLKVKALRKSFATWATREGLDRNHVEAFLGHENPFVSAVTGRHYLADILARELRPTAKAIDKRLAGLR